MIGFLTWSYRPCTISETVLVLNGESVNEIQMVESSANFFSFGFLSLCLTLLRVC